MGHGAKKSGLGRFIPSVTDLFSNHVFLNIKGHHNVPTTIGSFLTLVLVLAVVGIAGYSVKKMIFHDNPVLSQLEEYKKDAPPVFLNSTNNFKFAIGVALNGKSINMSENSILTFVSSINTYVRKGKTGRDKVKYSINYAPCTIHDFPDEIFGRDTNDDFNLTYAYCPQNISYMVNGTCAQGIPNLADDCTGPLNFEIGGQYLSKRFTFLQGYFSLCDSNNDTLVKPPTMKCMKSDKIEKLFASNAEIKVNLYYANNVMEPNNYATPNKTFFDVFYWTVNPRLSKFADIFVDSSIMQDYSHWLKPSAQNSTYYTIDSNKAKESVNMYDPDTLGPSLTLLTWNVRRSTFNLVTTRNYTKLLDILGAIGGLSKSLLFFLAVFVIGYAKYKYHMVLSNEMYDFEPTGKRKDNKRGRADPKETQAELSSAIAGSTPQESLLENDHLKSNPGAKEDVKEYFDYQKEKKRGLKFNEFAYLRTFCCCRRKSEDEKLAQKATHQVEEDADLILILRKLREIDKLKTLLLDRDQRELFNYNPKPIIKKDGSVHSHDETFKIDHPAVGVNPDRFFESEKDHENLSEYGKLYVAYRNAKLNNDPIKEAHNKRLLDMLGPDLLRVFEYVDIQLGDSCRAEDFEKVIERAMNDKSIYNRDQVINVSKDYRL